MRVLAFAFAVTLVTGGAAFAQCNWSATVADKATETTVTAEAAPIQTPVPTTPKTGS